MKIVDPCIQMWNRETHRYPWLEMRRADTFIGPVDAIAKTHELSDFLRDAGDIDVLKVVHVLHFRVAEIGRGHNAAEPSARGRVIGDRLQPVRLFNCVGRVMAVIHVAGMSADEKEKLFRTNAERIYRI